MPKISFSDEIWSWKIKYLKESIEQLVFKKYEKERKTIMSVLEIKDLHVEIEGKKILKGVNLTLKTGEVAAIMGPNGTGKSTLSAAIMGNPNYEVTQGEVLLMGSISWNWK